MGESIMHDLIHVLSSIIMNHIVPSRMIRKKCSNVIDLSLPRNPTALNGVVRFDVFTRIDLHPLGYSHGGYFDGRNTREEKVEEKGEQPEEGAGEAE
jgi:hypothetical protein